MGWGEEVARGEAERGGRDGVGVLSDGGGSRGTEELPQERGRGGDERPRLRRDDRQQALVTGRACEHGAKQWARRAAFEGEGQRGVDRGGDVVVLLPDLLGDALDEPARLAPHEGPAPLRPAAQLLLEGLPSGAEPVRQRR